MRVAVTIVEATPGSQDFVTIKTGGDVQAHKDLARSLPEGAQKLLILSTSGVLKRRRVYWSPFDSPGDTGTTSSTRPASTRRKK